MNLVGKIFVFLILVASAVFMTMALMVYATHQNFQAAIEGYTTPTGAKETGFLADLKGARAERDKLKDDLDHLRNSLDQEKKSNLEQLAKLETERLDLANTNATLAAANKELNVKVADLTASVKVAGDALTDATKANDALRTDIRAANQATDEQLVIANAKEDQLHVANGQLADEKTRNEQLAVLVAKAKDLLRIYAPEGVTIVDPPNKVPPTIRGEILALDKEGRAEISLGTDDGLREGHTLEIFRGNRYLGRMEVLEAHPHRAVGKLVKEMQQDVIRKGDQVQTRLKT